MDINSILKNHNIDAINDNEKVIDRLVAKNIKEYKSEINNNITNIINKNIIENQNKPNGTIQLDKEGKIPSELLPNNFEGKTDNEILSIDNNKFKPILSFKPEKQFILMNSSKITSKGRTFEIDKKYLYMFDGQIRKYDENTFNLVAQTSNSRNNYADTSCIDDSFLYSSELNTSVSCIYKFDKNTLQTVATSPTSNDYTLRSNLISDDEFLYAINTDRVLCKYRKDSLTLVAKKDNIWNYGRYMITSDENYIYCTKTQNTVIKVNKSTFNVEKEIRIDSNANIFSIDCCKHILYVLSKNEQYVYMYDMKKEQLEKSNQIYCKVNYYSTHIKTDNNYVYVINDDSGTKGKKVDIYDPDNPSHHIQDIHYYNNEDVIFIVKSDAKYCYIYSSDGIMRRYYKNELYKILGYEKIEEE